MDELTHTHGLPGVNERGGYTKIEQWEDEATIKMAKHYKEIISALGEDVDREGLKDTPLRVAKSMLYLTHGYNIDPEQIIKSATFREEYKHMIVVKDIEIYSLCEHHMIPFIGKAHVAYIPDGYITGLSKVARVVDAFSRRLQIQERLTIQVRDCIDKTLKPLGVGVVIEAQHMCMQMRGVQKQNSVTTTSAFTGQFLHEETRVEFMKLISSKLH